MKLKYLKRSTTIIVSIGILIALIYQISRNKIQNIFTWLKVFLMAYLDNYSSKIPICRVAIRYLQTEWQSVDRKLKFAIIKMLTF